MKAYERLIAYTKHETASEEGKTESPSTPGQLVFAKVLAEELTEIGAMDVFLDGNGYVYATIPANTPRFKGKVIAFLAHMDVSAAAPSKQVSPRLVRYEGKDLALGNGVTLRAGDELHRYLGKTLVVTDGSTLLGADDKAGIAEIMTAAERMISEQLPHGTVKICFTPDEEIGSGAGLLDLKRLSADEAYTMDGDEFGAVEYETFHAASAKLVFTGVSVHPGSAKGILKNAILMASEYISLLPEKERPETTEGYEGYYFAERITGEVEKAELHCLIRDHDAGKFEARKQFMKELANRINRKYGEGSVQLTITESYRNMREKLLPEHQELIDAAYEAVKKAGGEPISHPVRGGTDGAALSFRGLPCPNLGVGGGNFHGRMEYACVEDMESCVQVILNLAEHFSE